MDFNKYIVENWSLPLREVAEATGLSMDAVKKRRQRIKERGALTPNSVDEALTQYREKRVEAKGRAQEKDLLAKLDALNKELEAAKCLKASRPDTFTIPEYRGVESEAVAIALASDWHVEETVDPRKISGLNEYNLRIAEERAKQFFARVVRLTDKEAQDVTIKTIVIGLLGDFISGNIHEELLENCSLRPIEAALFAQKLLASGIEFLLGNTDYNLIFPCVVGNHSRMTKKVHVGTETGNSLEYFMYHSLASMFEKEKRVTFIIGEGQHVYLDILGKTVRFLHGHSVLYQGGIGGVHIPLRKAISQWDKAKRADLTMLGHFHNWLPLREVVVNGSMIGYNAFALRIKADHEPPTQHFSLLDKKRGHTVRIPILFTE